MKNKLTPERIIELQETFNFFDKDNDGMLDLNDMREVLKSMGQTATCDDDIIDMINEVDYDGNGTIEFDEFKAII